MDILVIGLMGIRNHHEKLFIGITDEGRYSTGSLVPCLFHNLHSGVGNRLVHGGDLLEFNLTPQQCLDRRLVILAMIVTVMVTVIVVVVPMLML